MMRSLREGDIKIVPVIANNTDAKGGIFTESVDMSNAHSVTFVFIFGNVTTAGHRFQAASAAAAATSTTDFAKPVRITNLDVGLGGSDNFGVTVAPTSGQTYTQPTHTQLANKCAIMEIESTDLAAGHNWVRVNLPNQPDASVVTALAIVIPRYKPLTTAMRATT